MIKERQITRDLKMQDPGASISEEENDIGEFKSVYPTNFIKVA